MPKVVVLTIVEDRRVNARLRKQIKKGNVCDVLRKGMLTKEDVFDAVTTLL